MGNIFKPSPALAEKKVRYSVMDVADFIIMPGVVPVLAIRPFGPSYAELVAKVTEGGTIQAVECNSHEEAVTLALRIEFCVILAHAKTAAEAAGTLTLAKSLRSGIEARKVRIIFTSEFHDDTVQAKLNAHGITESEEEPINVRAMALKVSRHIKALAQISQQDGSMQSTEKMKAEFQRKLNSVPEAPSETATFKILLEPSLELESDCWIMHEEKPKRVGGRWHVCIYGPAPRMGQWLKADANSSGRGDEYWLWQPTHPDNDPFIKEEGAWIFRGDKPEYVEVQGARPYWKMLGVKFSLAFFYAGISYGEKIGIDRNENLKVARDSPYAFLSHTKAASLAPKKAVRWAEPSAPVSAPVSEAKEPEQPLSRYSRKGRGMMGPLALGFVASELLSRPGCDLDEISRRFCLYLAGDSSETRAELWVRVAGKWHCTGASRGVAEYSVQEIEKWEASPVATSERIAAKIVIPPRLGGSGETGGMLILTGEDVPSVGKERALAFARMAYGIIRSFQGRQAA